MMRMRKSALLFLLLGLVSVRGLMAQERVIFKDDFKDNHHAWSSQDDETALDPELPPWSVASSFVARLALPWMLLEVGSASVFPDV